MIKLSEESMLKAGKKTRLLVPFSYFVNAKEKFLKEIISTTPVNTCVIKKKKWNSIIADMQKILVVWMEDQTSHNIPLNQSPVQGKVLLFSILWKLQKNSMKLAGVVPEV